MITKQLTSGAVNAGYAFIFGAESVNGDSIMFVRQRVVIKLVTPNYQAMAVAKLTITSTNYTYEITSKSADNENVIEITDIARSMLSDGSLTLIVNDTYNIGTYELLNAVSPRYWALPDLQRYCELPSGSVSVRFFGTKAMQSAAMSDNDFFEFYNEDSVVVTTQDVQPVLSPILTTIFLKQYKCVRDCNVTFPADFPSDLFFAELIDDEVGVFYGNYSFDFDEEKAITGTPLAGATIFFQEGDVFSIISRDDWNFVQGIAPIGEEPPTYKFWFTQQFRQRVAYDFAAAVALPYTEGGKGDLMTVFPPARILGKRDGERIKLGVFGDAVTATWSNATLSGRTIAPALNADTFAFTIDNDTTTIAIDYVQVGELLYLNWLNKMGSESGAFFKVRKKKVSAADTRNIEVWNDGYYSQRGEEVEIELYIDGCDAYSYAYYADIITSPRVWVNKESYFAGVTQYNYDNVEVTTKNVTLPDGDAGENRDFAITIKLRGYATI